MVCVFYHGYILSNGVSEILNSSILKILAKNVFFSSPYCTLTYFFAFLSAGSLILLRLTHPGVAEIAGRLTYLV